MGHFNGIDFPRVSRMWNYSSGMKRFFFFFSLTVFGRGLELQIRANAEKNRGSSPPPGWASVVKVHFFSLLLMKRLQLLTFFFNYCAH